MSRQLSQVLQHLRRAGMTDGQLLSRYIEERDEDAFAALVKRHGPMVWGVCRRQLTHHQDAEDAFQATFLVLVQKAATILPREMVANWLYGVAYMTARRGQVAAAKARQREKQVVELPEPAVTEPGLWEDLRPLLDLELSRLPNDYRVVLLLCDLEGKTRKEVARQLYLPEGTVASRLARARAMLAKRLARHGLTVSGAALAVVLSEKAMAASPPTSIISSTINVVTLVAAGQAAASGAVSVKVAALTEGVVQSMLLTKLKATMAGLLLMGALVSGAGVLYRTQAAELPQLPKEHNKPTGIGRESSDAPLVAAKKSSEALVFLEIQKEQLEKKERKPQPLTSKELSGTWEGEKERVKVQIDFRGGNDAMWKVIVEKPTKEVGRAIILSELKRVDDKQSGTVRLRFDWREPATGKTGSTVLGQLKRDKDGALELTILPAATKHELYRPVDGISLHKSTAFRP